MTDRGWGRAIQLVDVLTRDQAMEFTAWVGDEVHAAIEEKVSDPEIRAALLAEFHARLEKGIQTAEGLPERFATS